MPFPDYVTLHWPRPGQPPPRAGFRDVSRRGLEVIPRLPLGWLPVRCIEATTLISLFVVTVLPGDLLPRTGNSKLSKNGSTVPEITAFASPLIRFNIRLLMPKFGVEDGDSPPA